MPPFSYSFRKRERSDLWLLSLQNYQNRNSIFFSRFISFSRPQTDFRFKNWTSLRSLSLPYSYSQVNSWGLFMMTSQATVIARDSSNFPIIIFPLLSSYFPTITARMHESIVLSRIDCMADWLVQVHTLNAFVVITKTLTLPRQDASKASNVTQWKIQFHCHNFSVKIQSSWCQSTVRKKVRKMSRLPATMRFHSDSRLHPTPGGLMQIVSGGCPQGLLLEGSDRPSNRVQSWLLNPEHHLENVLQVSSI